MRLDKVTFVEVVASGSRQGGRSSVPGLAVPILAGLAARRGIDVAAFDGALSPQAVQRIVGSDLLCLSATTPAAIDAYRLATWARSQGVPVLLGGPHASARPREALAQVDWVIRGAGEAPFVGLLEALEPDRDLAEVPSLGYREDGGGRFSTATPQEMPATAWSDRLTWNGADMYEAPTGPVMPVMAMSHAESEPSRTRRAEHLPVELVAHSLERARAAGAARVAFVDEDLAASPAELLDWIGRLRSAGAWLPPWTAQVSLEACSRAELMATMMTAGCDGIHVECRPSWEEALDSTRACVDPEVLRASLSIAAERGLRVAVTIHAGTDGDDPGSIGRLGRSAAAAKVTAARFLASTPYPGDELHGALDREGRMLTEDWSRFDGDHVVFEPARMSPAELLDALGRARRVARPLRRALGRAIEGGLALAAHRLPSSRRRSRFEGTWPVAVDRQ